MTNTVVILCGGRGSRLKPATNTVPKALVQLNGRPILDYIIDTYRGKGIADFILCVGYKAEMIEAYYKNPPPGATMRFSDAGEEASMLERLWAIGDLIGERVFVSYCDTFIDLDLEAMAAAHRERRAEATIVSARIRSPFGLLTFDDRNWATSFDEKPLLNYYIGGFLIEKTAFDHITPDRLNMKDGQGLVDFFSALIEKKKLSVFEHEGDQITFNTEPERQKAEEYLGQSYAHLEDM